MDISSIEFSLLFAVYSMPNIIAPLFAGLLVGKFGARLVMLGFLCISIAGTNHQIK